uniref:Uncharacterized protein n=1 Tax=Romanomermis culicivorax TaxID=13658 RepID=A0A915IW42_ROMCU
MPRPSAKKAELGPPPRWLKCPRHGKVIAGKFIPMKTPLCDVYDDQVPETCRFYVPMVFNVFKNHGKIGFWIDLTNTDRFYDKDDVEKCGATYYKLLCKGHGECPSEDKTRLFIHACKVFVKNNPDSLIAVHCTHGFNRTGFLIAAYLIEEKSWSAEAVVQAFAESRPPGIYKQDYLEELFKRYDDVKEAPLAPALPDWCDESEAVLNDQEAESSQQRISTKTGVVCVEGIPSAKIVTDPSKVRQVRQKCSQFCRWNKNGFPGSQPVSMDTDNIRFLEQKNYEVTWKADGVRYV